MTLLDMHYRKNTFKLAQACHVLHQGGVIAYPTEAVYGLGCDPLNADAVYRLLEIKQRPVDKGLILVAANLQQLLPYIEQLTAAKEQQLQQSWPGPTTWVVPAKADVPVWIRGRHTSVAMRVSAHPSVQALCELYGGPIISTSANRSGQSPARSALQVRQRFMHQLDFILNEPLGSSDKPTEIRQLANGEILRAG